MAPDEGPFRQSAQDERHRVAIDALFEAGFLYAATAPGRRSPNARRTTRPLATTATAGAPPGAGPTTALRFKTPPEGSTTVVDLIRGEIVFPHSAMDDFVAVKSTGQPLFALANVIDDRDMGITHVIRGEDLLPTTPRQLLLWAALDEAGEGEAGWGERTQLPVFAHLPMLVDERGRSSPSARTPSPSRTTATRATSPRRSATTWPCSAGARRVTPRSSRSRRSSSSSDSKTSTMRPPSST